MSDLPGSLAKRLAAVQSRIDKAEQLAGRRARSVKLVGISKTHPESLLREAYAAGLRVFGESYAQEFADKALALADLTDIEWHFVGHLQTNKAKLVAAHAHTVHALDRVQGVQALGKRAADVGRTIRALVSVNFGAEASKVHGVSPEGLAAVLSAIEAEPALVLSGLMTLPPPNLEDAGRDFARLAALREEHGGVARLPELSMGMSDDLEVAIARGATMVRIGTALFGERG